MLQLKKKSICELPAIESEPKQPSKQHEQQWRRRNKQQR